MNEMLSRTFKKMEREREKENLGMERKSYSDVDGKRRRNQRVGIPSSLYEMEGIKAKRNRIKITKLMI